MKGCFQELFFVVLKVFAFYRIIVLLDYHILCLKGIFNGCCLQWMFFFQDFALDCILVL